MKFTKLNYCQYLLGSQINYTLTNLANHLEVISHDKINRYLKNEKLTPSLLWDNVKELIEREENAYLIFDDTVIDKRHSEEIELTRWQYSGNEHKESEAVPGCCLYRQNGLYRYQRFISKFYGCCATGVQDSLED
jgi:hypothetical protein